MYIEIQTPFFFNNHNEEKNITSTATHLTGIFSELKAKEIK